MIVAIDFDGTWTREPDIFRRFVIQMQQNGHLCILVTGRSDEKWWGAEVKEAIGDLMPIVFVDNGYKEDALRAWMDRNYPEGVAHVIWIDDNPQKIRPPNSKGVIA